MNGVQTFVCVDAAGRLVQTLMHSDGPVPIASYESQGFILVPCSREDHDEAMTMGWRFKSVRRGPRWTIERKRTAPPRGTGKTPRELGKVRTDPFPEG